MFVWFCVSSLFYGIELLIVGYGLVGCCPGVGDFLPSTIVVLFH